MKFEDILIILVREAFEALASACFNLDSVKQEKTTKEQRKKNPRRTDRVKSRASRDKK